MMEYDCPKTVKDAAVKITPGLQAPTISPLDDDKWVAVRSMVKRTKANKVMDQLAALGAKAILTTDIRSCRALKTNGRTDRGLGPARIGRRHPVPRRAQRFVAAPPARRARVRPEVTGAARGADRRPDRLQGAGEAAQLGLVRV
jgi:ATP phosphoribosyltransferase-like protein